MTDYRKPENRNRFFTDLYALNLEYKIMPGLVYLYMPELASRNGWDAEQRLWFAFLNGLTQNPITSMRMFERLPNCPPSSATLSGFEQWFNENWDTLQFDTDRRYQKKETVAAIKHYAWLTEMNGSQEKMLTGEYPALWMHVYNAYHSFGRLSSFSYLEYVKIMGFGADCDDLLFEDKSGSKSHRNGMLFLIGKDELVWDKRLPNGQDGNYKNFKPMCAFLSAGAGAYLELFRSMHPELTDASLFTLESNLCTFKNHFFGRRYPGVYADMAWERIKWAEERGVDCSVFKDIRAERLPEWLRAECENKSYSIAEKAKIFPATGQLIRLDQYLPERYLLSTYNGNN